MAPPLILGLNQYTHSASCFLLDADGRPLFGLAKERVTRKKHHGGDVSAVVEYALKSIGCSLADIGLVVANNHLFPIEAFEQTLEWAAALHQQEPSFLSPFNLFPGKEKLELTHHLAHAWSALPTAPFDHGLIVVMDGMGSTKKDWEAAKGGATEASLSCAPSYQQVPMSLQENQSWREGETVFRFQGMDLQRVFKRWTCEHTPTFLYNYGFENMESLGALYSRISSHVFGDWNACGKIMGLAPWDEHWNGVESHKEDPYFQGPLEALSVNWDLIRQLPLPNDWDNKENHAAYARMAAQIQYDLEQVTLEFLKKLQKETGETNLCLVGGVGLNSTLNGRIQRESGFQQVYIPPWPGDDGVAVGCAYYGWHQKNAAIPTRVPPSPYTGRAFSSQEIQNSLQESLPWLEAKEQENFLEETADALAAGNVVGWFQGRSELGPRALGNRSILATPQDASMVERINTAIKKREGFRPFAPTVLAEHADEFFENVTPSPYMSITVQTRPEKQALIPAVVHVDGTARLQTLAEKENPLYADLIRAFAKRTELPMLLNTSFNIQGEPIVETPNDAIRSFLRSELDLLVMENWVIRKKGFPSADHFEEAYPQRIHSVSSETVADADGEPVAVHLMAYGDNYDSDTLELSVLDMSDGDMSVKDILQALQEEWEVEEVESLARLRRLWSHCLVHFG